MGRTLDYERSFGEQVVVTPRRFPLRFRHGETLEEHYALVGMAHVAEGWPLYYDAVNEMGLGMAGCCSPKSGRYGPPWPGWRNAASFELIPWVLARCATAVEARELLAETRVTAEGFSPPAALAAALAGGGRGDCFAAGSTAEGLVLRSDPAGVLTNEPPLDAQLLRLRDYRALSAGDGADTFAPGLALETYSRGHGGAGLARRPVVALPVRPGGLHTGNALPDYGVGRCSTFWARGPDRRVLPVARGSSGASTPPRGTRSGACIITPPTKTAASPPWICNWRRWTARRWRCIPCAGEQDVGGNSTPGIRVLLHSYTFSDRSSSSFTAP